MGRVLASGKLASKIVFFEKRFEVPDYDDPKVVSRTRWRIIHTPWFGIYLHKWNKPDPRPTLHNHPWPFISFILKGSYEEHRLMDLGYKYGYAAIHGFIKWVNIVKRDDYHAVTSVKSGTISLMFVGKTHEDWGYWTDKGYVNFDKHPHSKEFASAMKARKDHITNAPSS